MSADKNNVKIRGNSGWQCHDRRHTDRHCQPTK